MKFWSNSDAAPTDSSNPEKKLLAAVLQRAITDLLTGEGDVRECARTWLLEAGLGINDDDSDDEAPLSFDFICEALDLDGPGLRKAISLHAASELKIAVNDASFN